MDLYDQRYNAKALTYALGMAHLGRQCLHVYSPRVVPPTAPRCFRAGRPWAHLLDADDVRLRRTARGLGVRTVFVHHEASPRQHVDLVGRPLARAVGWCLADWALGEGQILGAMARPEEAGRRLTTCLVAETCAEFPDALVTIVHDAMRRRLKTARPDVEAPSLFTRDP